MDLRKPLFFMLFGLINLWANGQNSGFKNIEQAFATLDYLLLEPFLEEGLQPEVAALFQELNESSTTYSWQIFSHEMLPHPTMTDIDFGLQENYAVLKLSAPIDGKKFELNYKYFETNDQLIIYYIGSYINPYKDIHLENHNAIQQFKTHAKLAFTYAKKEGTKDLISHLKQLENLVPTIENTSSFKLDEFNLNASKYYVIAANRFMEERNGYEAITFLEKARYLNPNDESIYIDMAICNIQEDDWDGAYEDFLAFSYAIPATENIKEIITEDLNKARYAKLITNSKYKKALNVLNQESFTSLEFEEE